MNHLDCYFRFLQECKNHGMTFVKTIRFPVRWAEDLMVRYPNLKLIYLVRCGNYNFSLWVIMSLFLIKKGKKNKNKTEMAIR